MRLIVLRSVGEIVGTFCFLTALFNMPIANATAILQSVPLAVTLGAALFFGEAIGWRRYLAIAIGFVGVILIVRPGSDGFNAYALWAVADRGVHRGARPELAADVAGDAGGGGDLPHLAGADRGGGAGGADRRVAAGGGRAPRGAARRRGCLLVAYVFAFSAMRLGDIGFVQPFRYSLLIWAIVLGILLFGEWPDFWMLFGSAIVVATGLFTFYRERRLGAAHRG